MSTTSRAMPPASASAGLRFAEGKWNLRIVAALLWKPMGFNQMVRFLEGISPNTLARRLDDLEALGMISRTVVTVTPPATLYTVEQPGRELATAIDELAQWGERRLTERQ